MDRVLVPRSIRASATSEGMGPNDNLTANDAKALLFVVLPDFRRLDVVRPVPVLAHTPTGGNHRHKVIAVSSKTAKKIQHTVLPIATTALSTVHETDIGPLFTVGGPGVTNALHNGDLVQEVHKLAVRSSHFASVYTGAFIMAKVGGWRDGAR